MASRELIRSTKIDPAILHVGFSPFYTAELIWHKDYKVSGDVDPARADICEMTEAVSFIH